MTFFDRLKHAYYHLIDPIKNARFGYRRDAQDMQSCLEKYAIIDIRRNFKTMTAVYEKLKSDFADATPLIVYEDGCERRRDEFMKGLNLSSQSQDQKFAAVLSWLNNQNIDISQLFGAGKMEWSDEEELKRFDEINSLPFFAA